MKWLARNPFNVHKRKGSKNSSEPPHPPPADTDDDENGKQEQGFSTFSEAEAEQQLQDADQEGVVKSSEETLVRIPGEALVNLVEAGVEVRDSLHLGSGEFSIVRLVQGNTGIAFIIKVGEDLRWPLTKDEPTLKLDSHHYLFSIRPPPDEEPAEKDSAEILNYGVTFPNEESLDLLDVFLQEHACFSLPAESVSSTRGTRCSCIPQWMRLSALTGSSESAYWTSLAPRVEDYNSVVAKAIAAGSGQLIKGLFLCTNAYASQVRKGGEFIRSRVTKAESKPAAAAGHRKKKSNREKINRQTKINIRRVKRLSRMTETMSENVLNGMISVTGAVTGPVMSSKAGQKFFRMLPGEVLLASLDAFNKVLDAAEIAAKDALSATSEVTVEVVSHGFGEDAGEMTHDTIAVGGHAIGTAWNVFKIRKTIDPVANGRISAAALKLVKIQNTSKAVKTATANK